MPVEIKELVIRAVVVKGKKTQSTRTDMALSEEQIQQIVQNTAKEVLRIMERKKSR